MQRGSLSPYANNQRMSQLKHDYENSFCFYKKFFFFFFIQEQKQKKSIIQRAFGGFNKSKEEITYREGYYNRVFETNTIQLRFDPSVQQNIELLKHLLFLYYEEDQASSRRIFPQFSKPRLCEFQSITEIDPDLIYYFIIATTREIYESYNEWLQQFVHNDSFLIDNHAFTKLINHVAGKDILGSKRFQFFKDILGVMDLNAFGGGVKTQSANVDQATERYLFNKMCESNDGFRFKTEYVNYWKFLPFVMSFYLYSLKKSINDKKNKFDLTKGIEIIDGQETEIKNIFSLSSIIKSMGINCLTQKLKKNISYRDIEKILMKFKNMNHVKKWMSYEHIKEIMKVFERKMRVDTRTKIESKRLQLHKVLDILTLKICLHDDITQAKLQGASHQKIILIVQLWHTAYYSKCLRNNGFYLKQEFQNFFEKKHPNIEYMNSYEWNLTLNEFFKKIFPLLSKQVLQKIKQYFNSQSVNIIIHDYAEQLKEQMGFNEIQEQIFLKLCELGELKIQEIFERNNQGIKKRSKKLMSKEESLPSPIHQIEPQDDKSSNSSMDDQNETPQVYSKFQTANYFLQKTQVEKSEQKQPDVLKSAFIMENFLHKFLHKSMRIQAEKNRQTLIIDVKNTGRSIRTETQNNLMNESKFQSVVSRQVNMNGSQEFTGNIAKSTQKSKILGSDFEDDGNEENNEENKDDSDQEINTRLSLFHKIQNVSKLAHSLKKQPIEVENGEYYKYMKFDNKLIEEMKEQEEKKQRNKCCQIF